MTDFIKHIDKILLSVEDIAETQQQEDYIFVCDRLTDFQLSNMADSIENRAYITLLIDRLLDSLIMTDRDIFIRDLIIEGYTKDYACMIYDIEFNRPFD